MDFSRRFAVKYRKNTLLPKIAKKLSFWCSNPKFSLTPPQWDRLNFPNLGGISSKSSGRPQPTGQTFAPKNFVNFGIVG